MISNTSPQAAHFLQNDEVDDEDVGEVPSLENRLSFVKTRWNVAKQQGDPANDSYFAALNHDFLSPSPAQQFAFYTNIGLPFDCDKNSRDPEQICLALHSFRATSNRLIVWDCVATDQSSVDIGNGVLFMDTPKVNDAHLERRFFEANIPDFEQKMDQHVCFPPRPLRAERYKPLEQEIWFHGNAPCGL